MSKKPEINQQLQEKVENTGDRLSNSVESTKIKIEQVTKELKMHLENWKNAHNPKIKENHKAKAANCLKKKKMYEAQLISLENSQFTMENMKIQSDMMKDQIEICKTMQMSSNLSKQLMSEMSVDSMYDLASDMKEMHEEMNEMNEVFQESYKVDIDDGDLEAELDELDFEMKDNNFSIADLNKPNMKVLSKKEQDEKKLKEDLFS